MENEKPRILKIVKLGEEIQEQEPDLCVSDFPQKKSRTSGNVVRDSKIVCSCHPVSSCTCNQVCTCNSVPTWQGNCLCNKVSSTRYSPNRKGSTHYRSRPYRGGTYRTRTIRRCGCIPVYRYR